MRSLKGVFSVVTLCFLLVTFSCGEDDSDKEMVEEIEEEKEKEPEPEVCGDATKAVFNEKDGLVVVEAEDVKRPLQWRLDSSIAGYSGRGYLVANVDNFNTPGTGKLTYKINIQTPGTYRFIWKSRITAGTSNTDHNDNWLKLPDADDFYAKRRDDGRIIYPHGSGKEPNPDGKGASGWFKVYMNTVGSWRWLSRTSDNDPHEIYAEYKNAGIYTVEISARSEGHGIDRFVLYKEDQVGKGLATADDGAASTITCTE